MESPFSRGLLSGELSGAELAPDDMRRGLPRFSDDNITFNQHLVTRTGELALELGCSPAQFALAWLVAQGVVPIPGAQRRTHMSGNASAGKVTLTADVLRRVDEIAPAGAFAGERFPDHLLALVQED
ncbi:aldo/keto reductase [Streptomyces sp. NPDC127172]|uniref:aldo/keto reductase n=1 Tax=Streptomyces sp. NPDC127172 TaxID=3345382 RepID=UPI0036287F6F